MDIDRFKHVYEESRNGADHFIRHPLVRHFVISDGVRDLAECGCWWLLDIVATECLVPLHNSGEHQGMVEVEVAEDNKATLSLTIADDVPPVWRRVIEFTDMPAGRWVFPLAKEDGRFVLILLTEY